MSSSKTTFPQRQVLGDSGITCIVDLNGLNGGEQGGARYPHKAAVGGEVDDGPYDWDAEGADYASQCGDVGDEAGGLEAVDPLVAGKQGAVGLDGEALDLVHQQLEERQRQYLCVRARHPTHTPVVVERAGAEAPAIDKEKYLVGPDLTVAQFAVVSRRATIS